MVLDHPLPSAPQLHGDWVCISTEVLEALKAARHRRSAADHRAADNVTHGGAVLQRPVLRLPIPHFLPVGGRNLERRHAAVGTDGVVTSVVGARRWIRGHFYRGLSSPFRASGRRSDARLSQSHPHAITLRPCDPLWREHTPHTAQHTQWQFHPLPVAVPHSVVVQPPPHFRRDNVLWT
eukprot:3023758-Prymnesium_polylepis.1